MDYQKAKSFILNKLQHELPANLYYHSYNHTVDVLAAAERIGAGEGLEEQDLTLLRTAALYHDVGFTEVYAGHEDRSCDIARATLPDFGYTPDEVESICNMIIATKLPQTPGSKMDQMICDADIDYLGRDDFFTIGNNLFREFLEFGIIESEEAWNRLQVNFLENHTYFTRYSQEHRAEKKAENLEAVRAIVAGYDS